MKDWSLSDLGWLFCVGKVRFNQGCGSPFAFCTTDQSLHRKSRVKTNAMLAETLGTISANVNKIANKENKS